MDEFENIVAHKKAAQEGLIATSSASGELRDRYAGQALVGLMRGSWDADEYRYVAGRAFDMADAMMAERAKRMGGSGAGFKVSTFDPVAYAREKLVGWSEHPYLCEHP